MVKSKKPSIEQIVKRKDRSIDCPQCWRPMRYKRVPGAMAGWSPSPYAWFCQHCDIYVLDGPLDPNEDTWEKRAMEEDRKRLSSYLASILRTTEKK